MELTQKVNGIVLEKTCRIKESGDLDVMKQVTLKIRFDGITLSDVFAKAVSSTVISWQNGPGRSKFNDWEDGQVVEVDFKAPGQKAQVDPKTAMRQKATAAGIDVNDPEAFSIWLSDEFGI